MLRFDKARAKGEIVFTTDDISLDEMRRLVRGKYKKDKYSAEEIIARETYDKGTEQECKIDLRWKNGKTEIIVSLKGIKNLYSAMQMNAKHNLIQLPQNMRNSTGIIKHSVLNYSDVAPFCLKETRPQDIIGNVMLKNLKRTNGYCQMLRPKPPQKFSDVDISAQIDELNSRKAKFQYTTAPEVKVIMGDSITIRLVSLGVDRDTDGNDTVYVQIDDLPEINLFRFALKLADYIPLYRCFKIGADRIAMSEMLRSGWRVSQDNLDALSKNDVHCLFVSDHMIVWRNFWEGDSRSLSNAVLSNRIKSTIALFDSLKDSYESED